MADQHMVKRSNKRLVVMTNHFIHIDQLTIDVIDQAVLSTKEVAATKGRASYVGERSIGHIDPGSYSSGLLFKALLEAEG